MPDLLTHFLSGYIIGRPISKPARRAVFYIGAILPDILSRVPVLFFKIILNKDLDKLGYFFTNLHSPFVVIWISLLISLFFAREKVIVFSILLAGSGLHLFLDFLQRHFTPSYFWLFPFSWKTGELGLFWPGDTIYAIPVLIGIIIILEAMIFIRKKT